MKNFIFKSDADFHKILFNKLDMILTENRHQRNDLSIIISMLHKVENSLNLQKQVDEYFDEEDSPNLQAKNIPLEDMAQDGTTTRD